MSFSVPRNVPSFNDPARRYEDAIWSSSGRSRHSNQGSNSFTDTMRGIQLPGARNRELPMYKDKPYNYPGSQRRGRKRTWVGIIALLGVGWLYYSGWLTGARDDPVARESAGSGLWGTFSSTSKKGEINWTARQEQVRKAMQISWSGYEKYAWGT
jgi:mannosyl-oligosaccharide alpha-1,2-mannosidase